MLDDLKAIDFEGAASVRNPRQGRIERRRRGRHLRRRAGPLRCSPRSPPSASSARSARPKRAASRPPGASPRSAPNAPRCFWRAGHGKSTPPRTRFHLRRRPLQGAPRNLLTNAAILRCGGHFMPEANRHYAARDARHPHPADKPSPLAPRHKPGTRRRNRTALLEHSKKRARPDAPATETGPQ